MTTARLNNAHKTLNNLGAHKATNVDVESRSSSSNNLCFVFTPCAKAVTSSHELSHMTSLKKNSNHYTVEEGGYQHPVYGEGGEPVYTELDKVRYELQVQEKPLPMGRNFTNRIFIKGRGKLK